jgi:hypothetical protein
VLFAGTQVLEAASQTVSPPQMSGFVTQSPHMRGPASHAAPPAPPAPETPFEPHAVEAATTAAVNTARTSPLAM